MLKEVSLMLHKIPGYFRAQFEITFLLEKNWIMSGTQKWLTHVHWPRILISSRKVIRLPSEKREWFWVEDRKQESTWRGKFYKNKMEKFIWIYNSKKQNFQSGLQKCRHLFTRRSIVCCWRQSGKTFIRKLHLWHTKIENRCTGHSSHKPFK